MATLTALIRKRRFESAWTPAEDQHLRRAYRVTDTDMLAERFGRTRNAIRVRAKRIGAAAPKVDRPWTADEERFVMEPKYTLGEKARILRRTRSSVSAKRFHLRRAAFSL